MPKVISDRELAGKLEALAVEHGSYAAAASAIGVERTLLWRVCKTGRAIGRNKALLVQALNQQKATNRNESATTSKKSELDKPLHQEELGRIRQFFTTMITLLDAYDKYQHQCQVDAARPRGSESESFITIRNEA